MHSSPLQLANLACKTHPIPQQLHSAFQTAVVGIALVDRDRQDRPDHGWHHPVTHFSLSSGIVPSHEFPYSQMPPSAPGLPMHLSCMIVSTLLRYSGHGYTVPHPSVLVVCTLGVPLHQAGCTDLGSVHDGQETRGQKPSEHACLHFQDVGMIQGGR